MTLIVILVILMEGDLSVGSLPVSSFSNLESYIMNYK